MIIEKNKRNYVKGRIYIAGKISGLDYNECVAKFSRAETALRVSDWGEVANPMKCKIFGRNDDWEWCMGMCILMLLRCEAIYMLRDWRESRGARIEYGVAKEIGMEILYQN
jgi:hypothetical protein